MKMLLLVFQQSLNQELHKLLDDLDVKAFTPNVFGMEEAGTAFSSLARPGSNSMILAGIEEELVDLVVARLKTFRDQLVQRQQGAKMLMQVFILPCEPVL
jgi:hypothetical protein